MSIGWLLQNRAEPIFAKGGYILYSSASIDNVTSVSNIRCMKLRSVVLPTSVDGGGMKLLSCARSLMIVTFLSVLKCLAMTVTAAYSVSRNLSSMINGWNYQSMGLESFKCFVQFVGSCVKSSSYSPVAGLVLQVFMPTARVEAEHAQHAHSR